MTFINDVEGIRLCGDIWSAASQKVHEVHTAVDITAYNSSVVDENNTWLSELALVRRCRKVVGEAVMALARNSRDRNLRDAHPPDECRHAISGSTLVVPPTAVTHGQEAGKIEVNRGLPFRLDMQALPGPESPDATIIDTPRIDKSPNILHT